MASSQQRQPIEPPSWDDSAIQALISARVNDRRAVGLAVALVEPAGRVRYFSAGRVSADGAKVDADTIFEIGSITKGFTGVLLAQAVESGVVRLEDRVGQRAPSSEKFAPGTTGDISLRQLATHTSGLPRLPMSWPFFKSMLSDPANPYRAYSSASMWQYLATRKHDSAVTHQPEYSNLGFGLLGELLAVSQGTSYEALIQRDIAKPLGMRDTGVALAPEAMARMAIGHDSKLAKTPYWDLPAMAGAGALKSSLRDMTVFMRALQSGALPGAQLATRAQVAFGENRHIGLGWIRSQRDRETLVWHNGGTGGFRSFSGYSEQSGLAVVVLSNAAISVDDLGVHLLDPRTPLATKAKEEVGAGPIWIAVFITLCVWIATVLMPWRLRFKSQADAVPLVDASLGAEQAPKSRIREVVARAIKPRFVTSRADSLWVALEIALVAALLGAFGPWGFLGMWAKWGIVTSILLGAVLVPIRARHLPWSDSAPISSGKLWSRAFTGILVIGVLALWLA